MNTSPLPLRGARQRGFSMIEVLIGLLIAMIGVVIMMEVLITSEQRARTTSSGNDAMSGGAIMMHLLQRDLLQAGYGINSTGLLGCNLVLPNGKKVPLAPVVIYKESDASTVVPKGDPNTDRLLVVYGSDNGQPEGNTVYSVTGSAHTVQAPTAFSKNDYVIAYTGSCAGDLSLSRVTAVDVVTVTLNAVTAGVTMLYNLGQAPHVVAYAVRNGALSMCDYMAKDCTDTSAANWTAVGGNIVALRAQYGRDDAGAFTGVVDTWDRTTPDTACKWVRTNGVRYALVARSTQFETKLNGAGQRVGDVITSAAPGWQGATLTTPTSEALAIDLSKKPDNTADPDWQSYRYRTFENIAPWRNLVWMGSTAGC